MAFLVDWGQTAQDSHGSLMPGLVQTGLAESAAQARSFSKYWFGIRSRCGGVVRSSPARRAG